MNLLQSSSEMRGFFVNNLPLSSLLPLSLSQSSLSLPPVNNCKYSCKHCSILYKSASLKFVAILIGIYLLIVMKR